MSEQETREADHVENYVPPPQKSLNEILEQDKDDEALERYKKALLGSATSTSVIVDPNDPRKVILKKLALVPDDGPTYELDLTGDVHELKKKTFVIKEGITYRIRIDFIVQREIVHGLRYIQKTHRLGVQVDKMTHMVGSYPPREEIHSFLTPKEEAPEGLTGRGTYAVKSLFTDDDGNEHLKWEWQIEIKKKWENE